MTKQRIGVILASTREGRNGAFVLDWLQDELALYGGELEFSVIDMRDYKLPHFDEPRLPAQRAYEHEHTKKWSAEIDKYDGYIMVIAEYNHGYPSIAKDALDYLYHEWVFKPMAFVGYGTDGAIRSVEYLRSTLIELNMAPVRRYVAIQIWEALGKGKPFLHEAYGAQTQELLRQLEWWAVTMKEARQKRAIVY